uniref:Uncharacterized protein n=1 Tax=Rhizophora mucronata TaxID=61149 RepID=A0A2P2PQY3_RHIMU
MNVNIPIMEQGIPMLLLFCSRHCTYDLRQLIYISTTTNLSTKYLTIFVNRSMYAIFSVFIYLFILPPKDVFHSVQRC